MHLFFSNGGWVRLAAIDFQADHQYFKIYFETETDKGTTFYIILKKMEE